jgi:hypothetical protein
MLLVARAWLYGRAAHRHNGYGEVASSGSTAERREKQRKARTEDIFLGTNLEFFQYLSSLLLTRSIIILF